MIILHRKNGRVVAVGSSGDAQDIIKSTAIYAASSTGTDAYVVTLPTAPSAYVAGLTIRFKADVANTGVATLDVNTLGVITIKKNGNEDLQDNDIEAGKVVTVIYDGTNFQLQTYIKVRHANYSEISGSRAVNTNYQNTTGRWMLVAISLKLTTINSAGSSAKAQLFVENVATPTVVFAEAALTLTSSADNQDTVQLFVLVPPSEYYRLTTTVATSGTASIVKWWEAELST